MFSIAFCLQNVMQKCIFPSKPSLHQIRVCSLLTFWNILQAKCTQNVYKYIFALAILHRKQTKIQLPWPAAIVLHFAMQNAYTMLFLKDCGCAKMHFCKQNVHKNVFLQRNTINFIKF